MKRKIKELREEISVPEGIDVIIEPDEIIVKKDSKQIKRTFSGFSIKKEGDKLILSSNRATKKERKIIKTYSAHLKNMIKGFQEEFVYKLKICSVHFPMNISVDRDSNQLIIKNFLGEKEPRKAQILNEVNVEVNGDKIIVKSFNKENAGQTAANFEKATKVRLRDRRIFQDGLFITEKAGRKI